jgi:hypothetical protein
VKRFLESEYRIYIESLGGIYTDMIYNLKHGLYTYSSYTGQYTFVGIPAELILYKKFFRKIKYDSRNDVFTFVPENDNFENIIAV